MSSPIPASNVELLSFDSYMELDLGGNTEQIPISSFDINTKINGIPSCTVIFPTGVEVTGGANEYSPIHELLDSTNGTLSNDNKYANARVFVKSRTQPNASPVLVFSGSLISTSPSFVAGMLQITGTIMHKFYSLSLAKIINRHLHVNSELNFAEELFKSFVSGHLGTAGGGSLFATLQSMWNAKFIEPGLADDAGKFFRTVLLKWLDMSLADVKVWLNNTDANRNNALVGVEKLFPAGFSPRGAIESIKSDKPPTPPVVNSDVPILKIKNTIPGIEAELFTLFKKNLTVGIYNEVSNASTVWSTLMSLSKQFNFVIIPSVKGGYFVANQPIIKLGDKEYKELTGILTLNSSNTSQTHTGVVIVMPSQVSVSNGGVSDGTIQADMTNFYSQYLGEYFEKNKTGLLKIIPLSKYFSLWDFELDKNPLNTKPNATNTLTSKGIKSLAGAFAKQEYWSDMFKNQSANISLPLRFDITPGSTVKFKVRTYIPGGGFTNETEAERSLTYVGYVETVRMVLDAMNGSAITSLQVSYVRPIKYDFGGITNVNEHPFYEMTGNKPFINTAWADGIQSYA